MHHFVKISGQRAIVKAAQQVEKELRKVAKREGIVLADIDFGLRVQSVKDDDIILNEQERRAEIIRWMGLPIGTQAAFNFKKDNAPAREGAAAGARAAERKSPYDAGSFDDQEWLTAYDGAQAEMLEAFSTAMEKKQAERMAASRRESEEPGTPDNNNVEEGAAEEQEPATKKQRKMH
jgi:hypothetical protein